MQEEQFIDVNEASELLGITPRALREARYRDESPPYYKLSKCVVRYRKSEVEAWREEQRVEA